jgi:potassium-dependent mechanosensitive channel
MPLFGHRHLVWLALALLAAAPPPPLRGQEPVTQPASEPATVPGTDLDPDEIAARAAQIEASADLSLNAKTEAAGLYRQALEQVRAAASWAAKATDYRQRQDDAPVELAAVRQRIAQAATQPASGLAPPSAADVSLDELNIRLKKARDDLQAVEDRARSLETEAQHRIQRRAEIPDLLAEVNRRLQRVAADLGAAPAPNEPSAVALARRTLLLAQRSALEQEMRAYDEELRCYTARADVLMAKRDEASRQVADAQDVEQALEAAVRTRRQTEAEREQQQADLSVQQAPEALTELAAEGKKLTDERAELVKQLDTAADKIRANRAERDRWTKQLSDLQATVSRIGTAEFIGPRLVKLRAELNTLGEGERELRRLRDEFDRVQLRQSELDEARLDAAETEEAIAALLAKIKDPDAARRLWLEARVRELYAGRADLLTRLRADYEAYSAQLLDLRVVQGERVAKTGELQRFIEERILWVRSTEPLWRIHFPRDWRGVAALYPPLGQAVSRDFLLNLPQYLAAVLAFAALLALRPSCDRKLRSLADRTVKISTDSYHLTFAALGCTLVFMAAWPALLVFLSWRVTQSVSTADVRLYDLAQVVGRAFYLSATTIVTLGALHAVCRPAGLAEAHFRWRPETVRRLRREFGWLLAVLGPFTLVMVMVSRSAPGWRESFGRIGTLVVMILMAVFAARVLHPSRGAAANLLREQAQSWYYRLRHSAYAVVVAVPLLLGGLSALGYQYTATELSKRAIGDTLWLITALLLAHALLVRWLWIAQRRLSVEQARKRRAALAEARAAGAADVELPALDEETLDVGTLSEQARTLVRNLTVVGLVFGLWAIWSDMLPALGLIGAIKLWSTRVDTLAGEAVQHIQYVTVGNVVTGLFVTIITAVLARNIPGLLEMTVLRRLPLDAGGRFATTSLARYVILIVGVVAAFGAIGIGWAKVQWLAAAVTVGLGFGLQEIFANFVSGLMLLFERPIRIGDVVTVGGISGTVTRIRMRATTITDWDRKELVIPNKEFITGQVMNWTLSDATLRAVIPLGLAYGSNTDLAEELLHKVAGQVEHVLTDPAPVVAFVGFGESALNYELRVLVTSVDYLVEVRHQLNKAIDREFRRAGIEIAFPQRDVHIRSDARPAAPRPGKPSPRHAPPGGDAE